MAASALAWFAALAMLAVALVTVADIVLRRLGPRGVAGMVDLTELVVLAAAMAAIPFAFLDDAHVAVDLATRRLPPRALALLRALSALLAAVMLAVIAVYGYDKIALAALYGDRTQILAVPLTVHRTIFVVGAALAVATCLVALARALADALGRRR